MRKILAALLALLLCIPAMAGAEEWPDLTGEWVLTEIQYSGQVYRGEGEATHILTLAEHQNATYRHPDGTFSGWWLQPSPDELLLTDLGDRQYLFMRQGEQLLLQEDVLTLLFSRAVPEAEEVPEADEAPVVEVKRYEPLPDTGHVPGFDLVAASDVLELYADPATGEVAFYDLRNGRTVWSNPQDLTSNYGTRMRGLESQFQLEYVKANYADGVYNSYQDCVKLGGLTAWTIPGGVAFGYEVFTPIDIYYVPHYLTNERFEMLYAAAPETVRKLMYGEVNSFYGQHADGSWQMSEKGRTMAVRNLKKMSDSFVAAGMTEEEYWSWQALVGIGPEEQKGFYLELEWTLEGDTVTCFIPAERIVEKGGLRLTAISLAPYLGAVKDMSAMSLYIVGREEIVTEASSSIAVALERFRSPLERQRYRESWEGEDFPEWRLRQLAALSDDGGALVITAPEVELPAYFCVTVPGKKTDYSALSYRLIQRELYRAEYSAHYWGDLIDTIVRYQLLDRPYQPETTEPAAAST